MTSTRVFAVFALLLVAGSAIAANDPPAKDQCQTCKDLVNATRQELKDHAGDAKEFLLGVCESSPALLKETCVKVANSTGDAIQKALEKAYDTLTEDKLCATLCKETDAIAAAQEATAAAAQHFAEQLQSLVDQARATLQGMVQGPFDVACSTCKNMVTKTKDWIKVHQMDVRDFMHKKCDQMKDVDPVQCKETADQVADNVESALQSLYDTLDEDTVCAAFCPAPAPPTMLTQLQQAAARMVVQQ